jgi:uncharacterized protein YbcI
MSFQTLTRGQLERSLSQNIQALYRSQLGHQPGKVTCQLVDEKLTIVIEDSVTQPEKLLASDGKSSLAEQLCTNLNSAIRPQIKTLIERILSVDVLDLLGEAVLSTGRTGLIAILASSPQVRVTEGQKAMKKPNSPDTSDAVA